VKYAFVRANREAFRITRMCQVLQASRSGYYDWPVREESERSRRDRVLLKEIRKIHQDMKEAYGYPGPALLLVFAKGTGRCGRLSS
jgi:putative transposase